MLRQDSRYDLIRNEMIDGDLRRIRPRQDSDPISRDYVDSDFVAEFQPIDTGSATVDPMNPQGTSWVLPNQRFVFARCVLSNIPIIFELQILGMKKALEIRPAQCSADLTAFGLGAGRL